MRFWTYWSNLLKGFLNISKKMAFLIFFKSLWVHPHDVHDLGTKRLTLKTENVKFLTSMPQVLLQDIKKIFYGADWNAKTF